MLNLDVFAFSACYIVYKSRANHLAFVRHGKNDTFANLCNQISINHNCGISSYQYCESTWFLAQMLNPLLQSTGVIILAAAALCILRKWDLKILPDFSIKQAVYIGVQVYSVWEALTVLNPFVVPVLRQSSSELHCYLFFFFSLCRAE